MTPTGLSLERRPQWIAAALIATLLAVAAPAAASNRVLFLFGGAQHEVFLGCVACYNSAPFSVWNPKSDFGSTSHENSIWNREGRFGSVSSRFSPWNPRATDPPIVVDRAGNVYGLFTRNQALPDRVPPVPPPHAPQTEIERESFRFLSWVLDDYDWIITHLDEARAYQSDG